MKKNKHILVTLITSVITAVLAYSGYTLYAATYEFQNNGVDFDATFGAYHGEMNDYFNGKLEQLVKIVNDNPDTFTDNKFFKVPPDIDVVKDSLETVLTKCGKENVSGYCVSMGALSRYMNYAKKLEVIGNSLPPITNSGSTTTMELLNRANSQKEKVLVEATQARQVMEATVQTYNEFMGAFPMHKKYEVIIQNLIKYKLSLKTIKNQVMRFPGKFIDSSSSQCE